MVKNQSYSGGWLRGVIQSICDEQGIMLRTFSDGWLLELGKEGRTSRVLGYVFDLNSAAASSIGRDKVATYELLKAYNIPVVRHSLIRLKSLGDTWKMLDWSSGIVVKPLTGMSGENVCLFHDSAKAEAFMRSRLIEAWALSPLASITREVRIIMLDGRMLLSYGKQPTLLGGLKVFNLSKGAVPVAYTPTQDQIELAKKAQEILGLRLAAIDLVELASGEWKVLEVNSTITMRKYVEYSKQNQADAKRVYSAIIKAMFP